MKNLITILAVLFATATFAQTSPKWGTAKNQDNTYRVLNLKKVSITDVAGNDTLSVTPTAYSTYLALTSLDSCTIKIASTSYSNLDDRLVLVVSGGSGDIVKFIGTTLKTAGTATLSSGAVAVIEFIFNGTAWVEKSRVVQ